MDTGENSLPAVLSRLAVVNANAVLVVHGVIECSRQEHAFCCESRNSSVSIDRKTRPVSGSSLLQILVDCATGFRGGRKSIFCCQIDV